VNPASAQELYVLHSGCGRLRVHLPDPDGQVVACLCRLPGVTSAQASALTGNLLILFNPRQTSTETLLAELEALCEDAPTTPAALAHVPVEVVAMTAEPEPPSSHPGYVTGVRGQIYKALGGASVGLAVVGAILPGIPTAPFVILAGYFFIRSSPAAHAWLRNSRWFGPFLRDWEEHRAVRRSVKYSGAGLIGVGAVVTLLLGLPTALVATILALEAVGLIIVLNLPVVGEPVKALPAPATV
jgi:uncharacterized membrane protein YbaN (DUF454 family)